LNCISSLYFIKIKKIYIIAEIQEDSMDAFCVVNIKWIRISEKMSKAGDRLRLGIKNEYNSFCSSLDLRYLCLKNNIIMTQKVIVMEMLLEVSQKGVEFFFIL